jgi:biopolymer transport protein ExbB
VNDAETKVLELMHQGGWVMWALLAFSLAALAIAIERTLALRRARTDFDGYGARLRTALLREQSVPEALALSCETRGPVARVAESGLRRFARPAAQVEKSMERRAVRELRRMRRGLWILATTAGTAPLLGFLGTVTGMMASFDALSDFGTSNPGLVAQGIKEALTTTAAGLMVAVPAQIAYNTLQVRIERIIEEIESVASFLLEVCEESSHLTA